jgi:signal transduction histidine kinase/DNA-binding response OmpR family regulator/streptogramin lyase
LTKALKHILLIGLSLVFTCSLSAQGITVQNRFYGIEEGLSHRDVQSIYQDQQGFIWMGTRYGLNRFDGHKFAWYTEEKNGLRSNEINHILEDPTGRLWLFFTGIYLGKEPHQIDIFDPLTQRANSFENTFGQLAPFSGREVQCYGKNERGELLFVTEGKLHTLVADTFKTLSVDLGKYRFVKAVHWLRRGKYLLILDRGTGMNFDVLIIDQDGHTLQRYAHPRTFELSVYHQNEEGYKLFRYASDNSRDGRIMQFFQIDYDGHQSIDHTATETFADQNISWNYLSNYIGRTEEYYWVVDGAKQLRLLPLKGGASEVLSLSENHLEYTTGILFDKLGKLWASTQFGVYQFSLKKPRFRKLLSTSDNQLFACRRMVVDNQNQLFVLVENKQGIWKVDLNTGEQMQVLELQSTKQSLGMNTAGQLLFTWGEKLHYFDPLTLQTVNTFVLDPPPANDAWAIHEDKYGKIWFDDRGLGSLRCVFQDSLVDITGWDGDEAPFQVYQFFEEPSDTTWLSTNGGLYQMDIKTGEMLGRYWKEGTGEFHLPYDNIQHLHKDEDGSFWLATANQGLVNWHPQKGVIQRITRADGLLNNNLYAVYEDEQGILWLPTDNGINSFNKQSHKIRGYGIEDGLSHFEFNRVSHCRDQNGNFYFGSLNGVTAFNPKDFVGDSTRYQAPLVITNFRQFDGQSGKMLDATASLKLAHTITLQPADLFFQLEFALLEFADTENIRYAYRLEGQDKDWNYQKENTLRMSRLPYGTHTLRIKGQHEDGQWSKNELSIRIEVIRPLYLRLWFLLLAGACFVGLFFVINEWRISNIKARKKELEQTVAARTQQIAADKETIEQQARELKSLDQFKTRLFANISHELRTPLTLILGPISSVLKFDALNPRSRQLLQKAQQSGQDLLKLIGSILDLSKLEAGKMPVHMEHIHLYSFLRQIISTFRSHADRLDIQLTFDYKGREALMIEFDREKLKAILQNFLSNALKFTPSGGKVSVRLVDLGHSIHLSVADTGRGIHARDIPHVFDRFYQATYDHRGKSHMPEEGGTGLGLALCKEFADLLGADIDVLSPDPETGTGSIFYFKFAKKEVATTEPTIQYPIQIAPLGQSSFPAVSSAHILIVEDDPDLREYLENILSAYCKVTTAENGQVALDQLAIAGKNGNTSSSPDLILSDLMMPVMDGFQLLKKLKSADRWRHIPVIILTARADISDKLRALRIGVDDYLLKPFEEEELLLRIENLLKNHFERVQHQTINNQPVVAVEVSAIDEAPHPMISAEDIDWLEQLEHLIQSRMDEPNLTADFLADALNISRRSFFRRIKRLTGLTPNEYLREARLQYAHRMLENRTHSTVKAVALSVGFQTTHYFSNLYQNRFGRPPADYFSH